MFLQGLPGLILVRPVFIKERANGLIDTAPYVIATFLAMTPWVLSAAVLSGVIIALIVDLANILWFIAIISATLLCAESLVNLVASIYSGSCNLFWNSRCVHDKHRLHFTPSVHSRGIFLWKTFTPHVIS